MIRSIIINIIYIIININIYSSLLLLFITIIIIKTHLISTLFLMEATGGS